MDFRTDRMIKYLIIGGVAIVLLILLMAVGFWQGFLFILLFGIVAGAVYWLLQHFFNKEVS